MKPLKYNYNNQTGMYRNKILIQKQITETDSRKQQTSRFVPFGNFFAMLKTQKGDEVLASDSETTSIVDRFVIKYSKSLDELINEQGTLIRIVYKERVYDVISAINDNGLNEQITLIGKSKVGANGD